MDFDEVEKLLLAAANGWASREGMQRLEAILAADEGVRAHAAQWFCDESLLHEEAVLLDVLSEQSGLGRSGHRHEIAIADADAGTNASNSQAGTVFGAGSALSAWVFAAGVTALACSLLLNLWAWQGLPVRQIPVAEMSQTALLVKTTGCVWDLVRDSLQPKLGSSLGGGDTLRLLQGIAEVQVRQDGVSGTLRLQGPVSVVLRSDGMPILRDGRLVADVKIFDGPFQIEMPFGVVELTEDASLGIVAGDGRVAVHVFEGAARVCSIPSSVVAGRATKTKPVIVRSGEAVEIETPVDGLCKPLRIPSDAGVFAEEQSMATDQLEISPGYAEMVLGSDPVSYWRFEDACSKGLCRNEVPGGVSLRLVGSVAKVRQGGNHALEFGMTREAGHLESSDTWPDEQLKEYSVEFWFKPSHFHNGALFSLVNPDFSTPHRNVHGVLVEIGGPHNLLARHTPLNTIRYANRSPVSPGVEMGEPCLFDNYAVREWQHLVVVKDDEKLRMYHNACRVADATDGKIVPCDMKLIIGQIHSRRANRRFIGQMDEVALYSHALEESQVMQHYLAGCGQLGL